MPRSVAPATWRASVLRGVGCGLLRRSSPSLGMIPISRPTRNSTPSSKRSTRLALGIETGLVPEQDPVLVDTDFGLTLL
jgi:hypothetical protein